MAAGLGALQGAGGCGEADGSDGTGSASAALLCDGSNDVRFLWVNATSDVIDYSRFAEVRGGGFLVIDGQCRFWAASGATHPVTSGTLSADDAAALTTAIGYEGLAELTPYDDQVACLGMGIARIWSPASRANCNCGCYEDPAAEGWRPVLEAMLDPRVRDLPNARTLTSPLRLALIVYPRIAERDAIPWPLARPPAEHEIYHPVDSNPPLLDESSGVEITDPGELSALRAARNAYIDRHAGLGYTPLLWTDPDTQQAVWFHMLLSDELPAHVQAALERPLF